MADRDPKAVGVNVITKPVEAVVTAVAGGVVSVKSPESKDSIFICKRVLRPSLIPLFRVFQNICA